MKDILHITLKVEAAQNVRIQQCDLKTKKKEKEFFLNLQLMVRPKPEQPDRFRQPCLYHENFIFSYFLPIHENFLPYGKIFRPHFIF